MLVSVYYAPIKTIVFGSVGTVAYCLHDNVIEPVGETVGFFTKSFTRLKNWVFGGKKPQKPDKGLFGNAEETLFGDKSKENVNEGLLESIRKLIFGDRVSVVLTKEQKVNFVENIRKKFYKLVKNKSWMDNDIIVLSIDIDPKVMESDIKFDRVNFALDYQKNPRDYFKNIKT